MEKIDLEGFIYGCGKDVEIIYNPLLGLVSIDKSTKIVSKNVKPGIGKWCKFSVRCQEDGGLYLLRVEVMAYPRLKYCIKGNECIVEGTAVVCNLERECGYLWSDHIGFIKVEGNIVKRLNPLTAVKYQAVPFNIKDSQVYFMAKEVTTESGSVFQSDIVLFAKSAEVKEDGRAHVIGCAITMLKEACSFQLTQGMKVAVLYYKKYNDSTSGLGIYATTNKSVVAGIGDDFFTTERYFPKTDDECTGEAEIFSDAYEDVGMMMSPSSITTNCTTKISRENMMEVKEADENLLEAREGSLPVFEGNDSLLGMSSSSTSLGVSALFGNLSTDTVEIHDTPRTMGSAEMPSSSEHSNPNLATEEQIKGVVSEERKPTADCELESEVLSSISQEDLWDTEFIEHLKKKMKEMEKLEGFIKNDGHEDTSELNTKSHSDVTDGKEKLHAEMKSYLNLLGDEGEVMSSVRNFGSLEMEDNNNTDEKLSNGMKKPEKNVFFEKASPSTWTDEVDDLCAEVLSNARLRNFVSVNINGNAILRDVMKYLKRQFTQVEPECFDVMLKKEALEICNKLKELGGFEHIAGREIPVLPELKE